RADRRVHPVQPGHVADVAEVVRMARVRRHAGPDFFLAGQGDPGRGDRLLGHGKSSYRWERLGHVTDPALRSAAMVCSPVSSLVVVLALMWPGAIAPIAIAAAVVSSGASTVRTPSYSPKQ